MKLLAPSIEVIRQNLRLYIALNVLLYGIFAAMMIVTIMFPHLQAGAVARGNVQLSNLPAPFAVVVAAYHSGDFALAALLTFFTNLCVGALGTTTLPSLVIPFAGLWFNLYRFFEFGMMFAPATEGSIAVLPHLLTLIIEGQAYICGTLGAVLIWLKTIQPGRYGLARHSHGYKEGLHDMLRLYPLVIALLVIGAVYEAFELIYIVPHLKP